MKRRHALVAGFALGALVALAAVAAATWSGAFRPAVTGLTVSNSTSPSPESTPPPIGKPVVCAGAVMAYDPENHGVIMFGGATFAQTADGLRWRAVVPRTPWRGLPGRAVQLQA